MKERIIFHIDVNNAFLSWTAIELLNNGYSIDIREIPNDYYYTQVNKYKLYRCRECGAISRGRKPVNKSKISMVNNMR